MTTPPIPGPPGPQVAAKKGLSTGAIIAIVIGALVALCCVGSLVLTFATKDGRQAFNEGLNGKPTATAPSLPAAPGATSPAAFSSRPTSGRTTASPVPLKMPNVVGKNAAVAEDELRRAGFTRIQMASQDTDDKVVIVAANWTVTKQTTPAGETVSSDTLIVLTCTKKA